MTPKRPGTWALWSKNQSKPHKMSSKSILWQSGRFTKNWPGCRKSCAIAHENRPKRTISRKNKIRTRLAQRPTLVVICLKLWSVRREGTVRVTKCVILASVCASNCLLGKVTKWPIKGLERGLYGPKINRNLINCHLQVFCDNPEVSKNLPGCRKPCAIAHENRLKRTFSGKKIEPVWPGDLPRWCYALNYGRYEEEGPFEWRNVSFWLPFEQVIFC
jgi:hypothetical protein